MTQWLANLSPIISYLIGALSVMAGSILFLGAFFLTPSRAENSRILPTMRGQLSTIPPNYVAKDYQSRRERLRVAVEKLKQRGQPRFILGFARPRRAPERA
jgi:hypothetical protein